MRVNKAQRVGVFIDVQNMYYSARALHQAKVDFSQILKESVAGRNLIRAIAYVIKTDIVKDEKTFFDALENIGFEVKANSSVTKLAETEGVTIKQYSIIYELLEYLEKKVLRLLEPTIDEEELGRAKILKIFEINADRIAGCLIESGKFEVGDTVHVIKKDGETKNARIKSIRVGKEELKSVATGKECGILFFPKLDLREKDTIISYKKNKSLDE